MTATGFASKTSFMCFICSSEQGNYGTVDVVVIIIKNIFLGDSHLFMLIFALEDELSGPGVHHRPWLLELYSGFSSWRNVPRSDPRLKEHVKSKLCFLSCAPPGANVGGLNRAVYKLILDFIL